MPQPVRSLIAIVAGFLAMMVVVIFLTVVFVKTMHVQSGHPTPVYLWTNVVYSLLAALLGGWVTGRIARIRPVVHGIALAIIMALLNAFSFRGTTGQPTAYKIFLSLGPPLAAIVGSALAARRAARGV